MVISALARDDAYEFIMAGVKSGSYAGTEELDGKKVHHVKFQQEELDWEAWVDTGTPALPRKLTLDMSRSMRADASHGKITMIVEVANTNWMTNGPGAAERFQFTPREGLYFVKDCKEQW